MRVFKQDDILLKWDEDKTWANETNVSKRLFASQPFKFIELVDKYFPSKTKTKIVQ